MARSSLAHVLPEPAIADPELELLLPWHATGVLDAEETRCVRAAMASNDRFADEFATIRREQAAVVELAAQDGAPSLRPLIALFAAIDADLASPAKVVTFKIAGTTRYAVAKNPGV